MKTLRFADLKHKMSPARRAEIARAAKAEVAPAMTNARMERLKAKGCWLVEARYARDFVIWLRFADGTEGEVDLSGELHGPIFEPLRDADYFRRFALNPSLHTIAWPNGADLALAFLYERLQLPA
jgi:hypothetical protein